MGEEQIPARALRSRNADSPSRTAAPMSAREALDALHDDVAQDLFVARSALVQLNASLPGDQPAGTLARLALTAVGRAMVRTSELVSGLRAADEPPEANLAAGLQQALLDVAAPIGIAVSYRETGSGAYPPPNANPSIIGIVREALVNVREHAEASEVRVSVRRNANSTRIAVADNGHGLEPDAQVEPAEPEAPHHHGYGLAEMQHRASSGRASRPRVAAWRGHDPDHRHPARAVDGAWRLAAGLCASWWWTTTRSSARPCARRSRRPV